MSQTILDDDPLGIDTFEYPKVDIQRGAVRISEGWFLLGLGEDEPACYMDMYIFRDGTVSLFFDRFQHSIELNLDKIEGFPKTCQCYCECCNEVKPHLALPEEASDRSKKASYCFVLYKNSDPITILEKRFLAWNAVDNILKKLRISKRYDGTKIIYVPHTLIFRQKRF